MKSASKKVRDMVLASTGKTPGDIVRRARRKGAFKAITRGDGAKRKAEALPIQQMAS